MSATQKTKHLYQAAEINKDCRVTTFGGECFDRGRVTRPQGQISSFVCNFWEKLVK